MHRIQAIMIWPRTSIGDIKKSALESPIYPRGAARKG